ncbi:hypothetical protein MLD63_03690 [Paracoccus sp. TK19116]|uniref:Uncharacterized protein n=1 Tax=Paracoccus albicereus TaxID=2922394 RepID=A0ABT1MMM3_9RHOB|nr:hypothetical protein [Paracoccus albicereus]MCQ0969538.1 hypothetical protein [Paracoccus albicereus]
MTVSLNELRVALLAVDREQALEAYRSHVGIEAGKLLALARAVRAHTSGDMSVDDLKAAYFDFDHDPALLVLATPGIEELKVLRRLIEVVSAYLYGRRSR